MFRCVEGLCDIMDENKHCLLCQKDLSEQLEYNADKHTTSCKRKYDKKKQEEETNEKRKRKYEKGSLFGYFSEKQNGDDISLNASQVEDVVCGRQVEDDISSHKIQVENDRVT